MIDKMSVVDVFVGNYTVIDWELYALWVGGLTVSEAIQMLREQGVLSQPGVPFDLLGDGQLFLLLGMVKNTK